MHPGTSSEEHAKSVLRMRGEAERLLKEARDAGKRGEARQWQAQLRKIEKMIADGGLDRYA